MVGVRARACQTHHMTAEFQGMPCWFELATNDLAAAEDFYAAVLGWTFADSGMPDMTYHLATASAGGVAGLGTLESHPDGTPPHWLSYVAADDIVATCAQLTAAGGTLAVPPTDIPGTGTFAIALDPQGAGLGLLQPLPPSEPMVGAFSAGHLGHGGWLELMTPDPVAALAFYSDLFGWTAGTSMDMGEMGSYQLFQRDGQDIGGMMLQGNSPVPLWLPYFNVADTATAVAAAQAAGGQLYHGPAPVPSGQQIAVLADPQGATFAVVSLS